MSISSQSGPCIHLWKRAKEENDNEWKRPEKVQGERVAGNKSKHEKEKGN